ncbi:MAG: hypothetical protein PHH77_11515 [Victivallaceae bacterium]|nr:hypothetical protein [Victivallaceae bacterium]
MIFENADIRIVAVDYTVDYDRENKTATITPTLHAVCARAQILIASINVDDHELRPSLKLALAEGEHSYVLDSRKNITMFR